MPKNDLQPQESEQDTPAAANDYAEEFEAVQAVVAAEIAANAREAEANQLTEADLEAITF